MCYSSANLAEISCQILLSCVLARFSQGILRRFFKKGRSENIIESITYKNERNYEH